MGILRPSRALLLGLSVAILFFCPSASAQDGRGMRASAYSSLGAGDLSMRLSLGGPFGYAGVGLEAKGEELGLEGALNLQAPDGGGARLIAGPGSASGPLRLLVDPTSPTPLSAGETVELDRSFESRTSVLEFGAGPLSLFALSKGNGIARALEAAAAGLACGFSGSRGGIHFVAAASREGEAAESSGWRPDPSGAPASSLVDPARAGYGAALVADSRSGSNVSAFSVAATYGRLDVPSLAFRLESREVMGLCDIRLAASSAAPSFRELAGPREERLLDASAEARLAMRRASSLAASIEAQAKSGSLLYAPMWGRKGTLRLILPVGGGGILDTSLDAERKPEGAGAGTWSLALVEKAEEKGASRMKTSFTSSLRLCGSLQWDSSFRGLGLEIETELAGDEGLPALGLDLSLDLFDGGRRESPALATGGASLEFPFGHDASLELKLSLPERGIVLAPAPSTGPSSVERPVIRVRYRASLPASMPSARRRPRSSSSGRSKARSIAHRAAS